MPRARASLATSEPEFDEAWPEDPVTPRAAPHLVPALEPEDHAAVNGAAVGADVPLDSSVARGTAVPGRRTVTIRGQVASRPAPRRPRRDPYDRVGARPDRIAMWAVVLCLLLVLVAATSSHAAVLHLMAHARP
jgi:hypothetical protein